MRKFVILVVPVVVMLGLGAWITRGLAEVPAEQAAIKPSSYAPADALVVQVKETLESLHDDLEDAEEYGSAQIKRVAKEAQTLAVLMMVLGNHDQDHPLRGRTAVALKAALHLSDQAESYEQAEIALDKLDTAVDSRPVAGAPATPPLKWQPVGDIDQLMHQVPVLNTRLRGSARRLSRSQEKATRLAATLAAIAQVSMYDDSYCVDDEDEAKWVAYCVKMRAAAHQCYRVAREGNQDGVKDALKQLTRSCDDCHEQFREDEDDD